MVIAAIGVVAACSSDSPRAATGSSSAATDAAACAANGLRASATDASGAGGHESVVVTFTNVSAGRCRLGGYPTASFLRADGTQIGPSSAPGGQAPDRNIDVDPGAVVSTTIWRDNPSVPTKADCRPSQAENLHIELPHGSGALTVAAPATVCASTGATLATALVNGTIATLF
jgi:hypothetical protein